MRPSGERQRTSEDGHDRVGAPFERPRVRRADALTVHDEIVIEAPETSAAEVAAIVKETMENVFPLAVPLAVDAHWGRSWFDAKE